MGEEGMGAIMTGGRMIVTGKTLEVFRLSSYRKLLFRPWFSQRQACLWRWKLHLVIRAHSQTYVKRRTECTEFNEKT